MGFFFLRNCIALFKQMLLNIEQKKKILNEITEIINIIPSKRRKVFYGNFILLFVYDLFVAECWMLCLRCRIGNQNAVIHFCLIHIMVPL